MLTIHWVDILQEVTRINWSVAFNHKCGRCLKTKLSENEFKFVSNNNGLPLMLKDVLFCSMVIFCWRHLIKTLLNWEKKQLLSFQHTCSIQCNEIAASVIIEDNWWTVYILYTVLWNCNLFNYYGWILTIAAVPQWLQQCLAVFFIYNRNTVEMTTGDRHCTQASW